MYSEIKRQMVKELKDDINFLNKDFFSTISKNFVFSSRNRISISEFIKNSHFDKESLKFGKLFTHAQVINDLFISFSLSFCDNPNLKIQDGSDLNDFMLKNSMVQILCDHEHKHSCKFVSIPYVDFKFIVSNFLEFYSVIQKYKVVEYNQKSPYLIRLNLFLQFFFSDLKELRFFVNHFSSNNKEILSILEHKISFIENKRIVNSSNKKVKKLQSSFNNKEYNENIKAISKLKSQIRELEQLNHNIKNGLINSVVENYGAVDALHDMNENKDSFDKAIGAFVHRNNMEVLRHEITKLLYKEVLEINI